MAVNRTSALIASAQEMLDQRRDPFEDQAFCAAMEEHPELLMEVAEFRALHLNLSAIPAEAPATPGRWWWWGATPVAAALLVWVVLQQQQESAPSGPTHPAVAAAPVAAPAPTPSPTTPVILQLHQDVRTKEHRQSTGDGILQVKITTTRQPART